MHGSTAVGVVVGGRDGASVGAVGGRVGAGVGFVVGWVGARVGREVMT